MSLIKFGQYYGEVPNPTVGEKLTIYGIDGFDDQALTDYKKGDILTFIFHPNHWTDHLLDNNILTVEIEADVEPYLETAYTIVKNCQSVRDFFDSKQNAKDNDFLELIDYFSHIWKMTYESTQRHGVGYRPYDIELLTFKELEALKKSGEITLLRRLNEWTRIYGEQLAGSTTSYRIITVGRNLPDNCFLYDIHDTELYKAKIKEHLDKAVWEDEKQFWKSIIEG